MIRLPANSAASADATSPNEKRADVAVVPMPDAAAQELLAPPAPPPQQAPRAPDSPYQQALADGTIPVFEDPPGDDVPASQPALDRDAELSSWSDLLAFIGQHKDANTTVEFTDSDTFGKDLE